MRSTFTGQGKWDEKMDEYVAIFEGNEVDGADMAGCNKEDLVELGIGGFHAQKMLRLWKKDHPSSTGET